MDLKLDIKPLSKTEIPLIINYWLNSSVSFLKGMGADIDKLPTKENFEKMLLSQLEKPIRDRQSYALIWLVNDRPVGHCNVNPFKMGKSGALHLHLWKKINRNEGIGTGLLRKSLAHFFEVLELKMVYSEPYAHNLAPNKTLSKVGFVFEKKYTTIPGSINFEQEVNRWSIKSD